MMHSRVSAKPMTHRCTNCEADAREVRDDYLFIESGLRNVVLKNIRMVKCDSCGNKDPIISNVNGVMREIAKLIVDKPFALTGEEVRFLRKNLEMNQDTFAGLLHSDKTVVSRWENGHESVGCKSDLLIRLIAMALGEGLGQQIESAVRKFPEIKDEAREVRWEIDTETLTGAYVG